MKAIYQLSLSKGCRSRSTSVRNKSVHPVPIKPAQWFMQDKAAPKDCLKDVRH